MSTSLTYLAAARGRPNLTVRGGTVADRVEVHGGADEPARIRYDAGRALQFESPEHAGAPPAVRGSWMEPEGLHWVENIDECRYHAIRIELK